MRLSHKNGTTLTWSLVRRIAFTSPLPTTTPPPPPPPTPPTSSDHASLLPWDHVALQSASLAFICLLAVVGNFLVAFTLIKKELLVLPSNRLVFNLTGANFVFSLLVLPFVVASVAEQKWPFGIFWCNFTAFLTLLFGVASIVTLAMIAVDRYVAIVKPMMYAATITTSKSTAMLFWVWTQACICSIPPLFGWSKYEYVDAISACSVSWGSDVPYTVSLLSSCVLLPFGVMVTCYYFIFQVARTKCRKIHVGLVSDPSTAVGPSYSASLAPCGRTGQLLKMRASTASKRPSWSLLPYNSVAKGVRTISIVLGAFLFTWSPFVAMAALESAYGRAPLARWFQVLATWLMYSSSISYPVVYGVYNRLIRKEIRSCMCPPGAKAKKGLPRRNSRRLSFSGSLLDYSAFRFPSLSRRSSSEFSRASIDLGSLSFFRSRMRKISQDSGAVMTESDFDTDPPFASVYSFGRRSASTNFKLDQISAKFQKLWDRPRLQSDMHSLPILSAISCSTAEMFDQENLSDNGREATVVAKQRDVDDIPEVAHVHGHSDKSSRVAETGSGSRAFGESPKRSTDQKLFRCKGQPVNNSESMDEGIFNDCILEDVE